MYTKLGSKAVFRLVQIGLGSADKKLYQHIDQKSKQPIKSYMNTIDQQIIIYTKRSKDQSIDQNSGQHAKNHITDVWQREILNGSL